MNDLARLLEQTEQRLAALKIYQETGDPASVQRYGDGGSLWRTCIKEPDFSIRHYLYRPNPDYERPEKQYGGTKSCNKCMKIGCKCNDTWPKAFCRGDQDMWIIKGPSREGSFFTLEPFLDGEKYVYQEPVDCHVYCFDGSDDDLTQIPLSEAYEKISWPRYFKSDQNRCWVAEAPSERITYYDDPTADAVNATYTASDLDSVAGITEITAAEFDEWQKASNPLPPKLEACDVCGKPFPPSEDTPDDIKEIFAYVTTCTGCLTKSLEDDTCTGCNSSPCICATEFPQKIAGYEVPSGWRAYEIDKEGQFITKMKNGSDSYVFWWDHIGEFWPKQSTILWSDGTVGLPSFHGVTYAFIPGQPGYFACDLSQLNEFTQTTPIAVIVKTPE